MISRKNFLFALAVVALSAASSAFAQTTPAQTSATVPIGKIAVIFSEAFQDPKQGIAKFTVIQTQLNGEFKKPQDDLNAAAQKVQSLQDEITKLQSSVAPVDPRTVQAKM